MSNEPSKVTPDPIPAAGTPRPELPKLPDVPSLAALPPAPKPAAVAPTPAPAPVPAPQVPTTPAPLPPLKPAGLIPEPVWRYLQPTHTKGIVAAGVLSLLGGAAVMKYVWPAKPTATAETKTDRGAPLPEPTSGRSGGTLAVDPPKDPPLVVATATVPPPPVSSVELKPMSFSPPPPPPAEVALGSAPLPKIIDLPTPSPTVPPPAAGVLPLSIPDISLAKAETPPATAPAPAPTAVPPVKLPDPPAPASTVPPPAALPLPAVAVPPIGAASPLKVEVPPIGPLPSPGTGSTSPALELPKLDAPKLDAPKLDAPKVEIGAPPLPLIAVPGAPPAVSPPATTAPSKPLEVGVPDLTNVSVTPKTEAPALPKVDLTMPKVETPAPPKVEFGAAQPPKVEFGAAQPPLTAKPTPPALELPTVGAAPAVTPAPTATNAKTDYDVDLHYVKVGDSWTAVSKQYYGDERYAEALKGYNANAALTQLQRAEVPPIHVLRKNFASVIGKAAEKAPEWNAITPSGNTERTTEPRKATGGGYKTYVIPAGGKTIKEVAAAAYGDENYWGAVWDANPKIAPDKAIPEGTKIYLASQSKIGE